jgi:hypothetical protein
MSRVEQYVLDESCVGDELDGDDVGSISPRGGTSVNAIPRTRPALVLDQSMNNSRSGYSNMF